MNKRIINFNKIITLNNYLIMYYFLPLFGLLLSVNGSPESFKWYKNSLQEDKKFAVFINHYDEPVYVSLNYTGTPAPLNLPLSPFVKFYLYTQKNNQDYTELWVGDTASLSNSNFDKSKKTLIIIHGYMNNLNSIMIQSIKNNILVVEDVNVIAVDWSYIADALFYHIIAAEVPSVGIYVGDFINFLISNGLTHDKIHIIGHSLGAHVGAFAGKTMSSGKVARITGLDVALPGFTTADPSQRLNANDADFVDCIHTCGGTLGYMDPICQVDFYPNGGASQPGCTWIDFGGCSHGRSHEFFAESIEEGHSFKSLLCPSLPGSSPVDCTEDGSLMGYPATNKYLGIHYVQTNAAYPYASVG